MKMLKKIVLSLGFVSATVFIPTHGIGLLSCLSSASSLPDLKDDALVKACQNALADYSPESAKNLKIKIDKDFIPDQVNGYMNLLPFSSPLIVLNQKAVEGKTKYSTAMHEAGHIADPDKYKPIAFLPVFAWTQCQLFKIVRNLSDAKILNPLVPEKRLFGKDLNKLFLLIGALFMSEFFLGKIALAAFMRKREELADDFACKYVKNPKDLYNQGKEYEQDAADEQKKDKQKNSIRLFIDKIFDNHPSYESRAKKFFDQYKKLVAEKLKAKQEAETMESSIFMGL